MRVYVVTGATTMEVFVNEQDAKNFTAERGDLQIIRCQLRTEWNG